jgi:hypothetical protein
VFLSDCARHEYVLISSNTSLRALDAHAFTLRPFRPSSIRLDDRIHRLALEATHADGQPVLRVAITVLDAEDHPQAHAGKPSVHFAGAAATGLPTRPAHLDTSDEGGACAYMDRPCGYQRRLIVGIVGMRCQCRHYLESYNDVYLVCDLWLWLCRIACGWSQHPTVGRPATTPLGSSAPASLAGTATPGAAIAIIPAAASTMTPTAMARCNARAGG